MMGANGVVRIYHRWSFTGVLGNKTCRVKFGAATVSTIVNINVIDSLFPQPIHGWNQNNVSDQRFDPTGMITYGSSTTDVFLDAAVNTNAAPVDVTFTIQLGNGGDTGILEFAMVEVIPGV
jgi:hypothetical protein